MMDSEAQRKPPQKSFQEQTNRDLQEDRREDQKELGDAQKLDAVGRTNRVEGQEMPPEAILG